MEIVIGALVAVLVQIIKKLVKHVGSNITILIVFALTALGAIAFDFGKEFITQDFFIRAGRIFSYQATIWALFVKYLYPQIKENFS